MALDLFNIVASGLVFTVLATKVLRSGEREMAGRLWGLWVYWLLVSIASVRSLVHLVTDPHGWEKTPHHEQPSLPHS